MVQQQSVVTSRTDRLVAELLRDEHLDEIRRTHRDPKVTVTLGGPRSGDETACYLHDNLDHWNRYGIWLFGDRADGRFQGAGLRNTRVGGDSDTGRLGGRRL